MPLREAVEYLKHQHVGNSIRLGQRDRYLSVLSRMLVLILSMGVRHLVGGYAQ